MRVVVLVSGRGSNLRSLARSADAGGAIEIVGVVADRKRCAALGFAEERDVPTAVVRPRDHESREAWDVALAEAVARFEPELVVLAGFMRLVGPAMLGAFEGSLLNVHPSLLPAFPGMRAPEQAIEAGVRITGCTVHLVDSGVDTGRILAQVAVRVRAEDDSSSLHGRIQAIEHELLPRVVDALARGLPLTDIGDDLDGTKGEDPRP